MSHLLADGDGDAGAAAWNARMAGEVPGVGAGPSAGEHPGGGGGNDTGGGAGGGTGGRGGAGEDLEDIAVGRRSQPGPP